MNTIYFLKNYSSLSERFDEGPFRFERVYLDLYSRDEDDDTEYENIEFDDETHCCFSLTMANKIYEFVSINTNKSYLVCERCLVLDFISNEENIKKVEKIKNDQDFLKENNLKIGIVVQLKSKEGPLMTVESVIDNKILCFWFVGTKLFRGEFSPLVLVSIKKNSPLEINNLEEIAKNMKTKLIKDRYLEQESAAIWLEQIYGEAAVYINQYGNLAINKSVLKAFEEITSTNVVWDKVNKLWRLRESGDSNPRGQ
ncbi:MULTISPECIES: YodC family protein [unclassified Acinetobacter]|uniref:YodC family protein n=1 Tax=unclassified Acinetobacter TaxID=196816 RepID=UPI0015D42110|nr:MULTISPECIES: hypothetical protein [unclassified Acinetobacter]